MAKYGRPAPEGRWGHIARKRPKGAARRAPPVKNPPNIKKKVDSYFCRPIFGFLSGIKSQSTRDRRKSAEFSRPTCAPVSVAQQPFGFLLICGIRLDLLAMLFRSRHVFPVLVCPSLRRHSSSATRTTDSVRPLVLCSSLRCAPTDDELPGLVSNSHLHKSLSARLFHVPCDGRHPKGDARNPLFGRARIHGR